MSEALIEAAAHLRTLEIDREHAVQRMRAAREEADSAREQMTNVEVEIVKAERLLHRMAMEPCEERYDVEWDLTRLVPVGATK